MEPGWSTLFSAASGQGTGVMGQPGGNTGGYGVHVTGGPDPAWKKQQKLKGTPGGRHSNTRKLRNNTLY